MELEDVTASAEAARTVPAAAPQCGGDPTTSTESNVPARIYPEYATLSLQQAEAESARLKNRMRALAIRFESCDRTLGQALLASHRTTCAEAGAGEILSRIAALEVQRANDVAKGGRGKASGDGLWGGLLGGRRSEPRRNGEGGTSEGDLKVPEPIDRELVELARAVATDPRIAELPDETVRASLVKRAELAIEGADLEGRLRFLRRRALPSTLEHPRAAGEYRGSQHPEPSGSGLATGSVASAPTDGDAIGELRSTLAARLDALDRKLDRDLADLTRTLGEIGRRVDEVGGTGNLSPARSDGEAGARHDEILTRLAGIQEVIGRGLAAVELGQRTLTEELTEAFTRHEEAQLRILEREEELRAGRLEVANAQLAAETVRKQAAEAELEVARTTHAARMDEEQMRMRVDAARHAQTMREQEDAQARAIEQAAEESRLHAAEQTRAREARTAEVERMARLRSRAESAATSRRIREARERRRNTVVWVSVLSGLMILIVGLLWASGLLDAAAHYLRSQATSSTRLESPATAPTATPGPASPPARPRPAR